MRECSKEVTDTKMKWNSLHLLVAKLFLVANLLVEKFLHPITQVHMIKLTAISTRYLHPPIPEPDNKNSR